MWSISDRFSTIFFVFNLQRSTCQCEHNTCGDLCDRCCPLFNQRRWSPGTSEDGAVCQQCQCYGHANECHYDALVERDRRSLNTNNAYQGGGVCTNCSVNELNQWNLLEIRTNTNLIKVIQRPNQNNSINPQNSCPLAAEIPTNTNFMKVIQYYNQSNQINPQSSCHLAAEIQTNTNLMKLIEFFNESNSIYPQNRCHLAAEIRTNTIFFTISWIC